MTDDLKVSFFLHELLLPLSIFSCATVIMLPL